MTALSISKNILTVLFVMHGFGAFAAGKSAASSHAKCGPINQLSKKFENLHFGKPEDRKLGASLVQQAHKILQERLDKIQNGTKKPDGCETERAQLALVALPYDEFTHVAELMDALNSEDGGSKKALDKKMSLTPQSCEAQLMKASLAEYNCAGQGEHSENNECPVSNFDYAKCIANSEKKAKAPCPKGIRSTPGGLVKL